MPSGIYTRIKHWVWSDESKEKFRKPKTEEHIKRMSESHIGKKRKPFSEEHKLKIGNGNKGKHRSEESKMKNSEAHKNKQIGENNPFWKGGSSKYWRMQILIRDDYTCQICSHKEPEIMVADHILPKCKYPELEFEMSNLITLCPNCHMRKTQRERKNKEYYNEE